MDFIKVNIANFLTVGNSGDILLKNRGLNLLQGVNDDDTSASSNGSGKSTIPDAVCWALYGTTARGESGDDIVNDKVGKGCAVLVELEDGSATYSITRFRKHATGKNSVTVQVVNGMGLMVLTKGTDKETQLVINDLLGCTYDVFKASIYAGQEDMPDIPKMRDRQLKMLIEEAAGVQRLEKAYEVAKAKAAISARAVETHEVNIERTNVGVKNAEIELEGAKLKHAAFEVERVARIEGATNNSAAAKSSALMLIEESKKFDEPAITTKLTGLQAAVAGTEAARAAAENARTMGTEPIARSIAVEASKVERLLGEATKLRARFDNAAAELGKPCTACGKPHTADELDHLKSAIKLLLVAKVGEHTQATEVVTDLTATLVAKTAELERLTALVPDVSILVSEMNTLQTSLAAIASLKNQARTKLVEAQTHLAAAEGHRAAANPQDENLKSIAARIDLARDSVAQMSLELGPMRRTMEIDAAVSSVYSPAGVRAHILDTVTPFLNDRTSEYLGTLSDGNISAIWSTLSRTAKGELREKFVIDVSHMKGGKTFGLISGGEKRKVRLACMLALQDLVASRATKPLNLWMGDEIDDALDAPGIERLMAILEKKAREKGTVIVISHNELRDWIDDVTVVRKSGGVSTVSGALCPAIL